MTPEQRALDWLISAQRPEGGIAIFKQLSKVVPNHGEFVGLYPEVTGYSVPTLLTMHTSDTFFSALLKRCRWMTVDSPARPQYMDLIAPMKPPPGRLSSISMPSKWSVEYGTDIPSDSTRSE